MSKENKPNRAFNLFGFPVLKGNEMTLKEDKAKGIPLDLGERRLSIFWAWQEKWWSITDMCQRLYRKVCRENVKRDVIFLHIL
jgi:hypothetical protein